MKIRLILCAAVALFSCATANAGDFDFGVKAGISGNWMPGTYIDYGDRVVPNVGFYGGVSGTFEVSDMSFFQAEVLYSRKGVSTKSDLQGSYSRNISYLQIPLMFGIKLHSDRLMLMLGPEPGFCIGNSIKSDIPNVSSIGTPRVFNLALALQVTFMVTDNFGIDVKADAGLTRTLQDTKLPDGREDRGRNMCAQIGVCYKFN